MENKQKENYYIRPARSSTRPRMERSERAKQFSPFAALKGYPDALRKKEKIIVEKISLSEESTRILDLKMHQIQKRDIITVVYFCKNEYLKLTGMVSRIDITSGMLKIVNTNISFDDIYDISGDKIHIEEY